MISQRFAIPVVTAAAIHAAFFAFSPNPPPPDPGTVETVRYIPLPPLSPLFEITPPVDEAEKGGGGGDQVAELPEAPVVPKPDDFTMVVPDRVVTSDEVRFDRIPRDLSPFTGDGPGLGNSPSQPIHQKFLDHEPRARARVAPEYPYEAKSRGLEGTVEVAFVVGANGLVHSAHVVRSDHRELESAAVRAVMKWRFEPGKYQGRSVSFRMSIPIVFRIAED